MDGCFCPSGLKVGCAEGEAEMEAEGEDKGEGLMIGFIVGLIIAFTEGLGMTCTPFTSLPEGEGGWSFKSFYFNYMRFYTSSTFNPKWISFTRF